MHIDKWVVLEVDLVLVGQQNQTVNREKQRINVAIFKVEDINTDQEFIRANFLKHTFGFERAADTVLELELNEPQESACVGGKEKVDSVVFFELSGSNDQVLANNFSGSYRTHLLYQESSSQRVVIDQVDLVDGQARNVIDRYVKDLVLAKNKVISWENHFETDGAYSRVDAEVYLKYS